jgi:hypothetical protein
MATKKENGTAILKALDAVNQELQSIAKNQQGYGYKFRGIDQVFQHLSPLFKKHKILTRREVVSATRSVRTNAKGKEIVEVELLCNYIFTSLVDGSEFTTQGYNEGQDCSGGDKAASMATSNSYKYVIFEMFNIATNEQKDSDQVTAKEANKRGSAYRKTEVEDVL